MSSANERKNPEDAATEPETSESEPILWSINQEINYDRLYHYELEIRLRIQR